MSEIGEFREYVEEQRNLCYGVEGTTPGVHGRIARQYDFLLETIDTYQEIEQPQLNENQKNKTNNNLLKINDLAFDLQHDDELTAEQFWKVKQIFELSLQYQLDENQQIVLEWLKEEQTKNPELKIFGTLSVLFDESENRFMNLDVIDALNNLSNLQQEGVFQAFSKWTLGQEEENVISRK